MFYIRYIFSELSRRRGRTVLTSLGLAIGVGLVVAVAALSEGLDEAQNEILEPLTGVGTDMSVNRPLEVSGRGDDQGFSAGGPAGALGGLSAEEQQQLRRENGPVRFGLDDLGDPGESFSQDEFLATELSFPAGAATEVGQTDGVDQVSQGLTLSLTTISGEVPESLGGPPGSPGGFSGIPDNINFEQSSIAGVDPSEPELGLVTPGQIIEGEYFAEERPRAEQVIVSQSYASDQAVEVGRQIEVAERDFEVIGIAEAPLGGQTADIYTPLKTLQEISDRDGRINVLRVRAADSSVVTEVSNRIENEVSGAKVTTSEDLAEQVSGSLADAQDLTASLGAALAIVALVAAFLIASLLTLSSVNKRTRELGTLKALGWRQKLVVRQITGESLVQGLLGGLAGAAIGIGVAGLITAFGPTLEASVSQAASTGSGIAAFGQGSAVQTGTSTVSLSAPIDPSMIALAIGLAALGGLMAGMVGASRAARLRPAEALRSIE